MMRVSRIEQWTNNNTKESKPRKFSIKLWIGDGMRLDMF